MVVVMGVFKDMCLSHSERLQKKFTLECAILKHGWLTDWHLWASQVLLQPLRNKKWNVDKRIERNQTGQNQFSWWLCFMQRRHVSEEGII